MTESNASTDAPTTKIPRSATIASWLGKFAPSCTLAGILGIHLGVVPPLGGFMFFQLGLLAALGALIAGAIAFFATRGEAEGGPGRAATWLGLASGMLMITITIAAAGPGIGSPPINDVTTDYEDPPSFATGAEVPDHAGRDMSFPPAFVATMKSDYAHLQPIELPIPPDAAFRKAIQAADELGWDIVYRNPEEGRFDAQDRSLVFQFVDDVTVRIRPSESGSRVDVRSKSRDGRGDLGVNGARIAAFRDALTM